MKSLRDMPGLRVSKAITFSKTSPLPLLLELAALEPVVIILRLAESGETRRQKHFTLNLLFYRRSIIGKKDKLTGNGQNITFTKAADITDVETRRSHSQPVI
jgi:hypothetical protein